MKLVQLNCWTGRLARPLIDFLQTENPDVLCLQEVIDIPGGDEVIFLSLDKIQSYLSYEEINTLMSPVFSFNFLKREAKFGNAILSKLPVIKKETIFTYGEFLKNVDYSEDESNMRNLQHVLVRTPEGKTINILNHHGYHIEEHKNGDEETLRQCKVIAEYISMLSGPIILTGDFNLSPHSDSIKLITTTLRDLVSGLPIETTRTSLTNKTEVCDYIFINKGVRVKSFTVSDRVISDHKALVLEFDV